MSRVQNAGNYSVVPLTRFKIIEQAEIYALEMAKACIDAESVENLTP